MFDGAQAADYDGDSRVGDLEAKRPGGPWMALEGRVRKRDVGERMSSKHGRGECIDQRGGLDFVGVALSSSVQMAMIRNKSTRR